MYSYIITFYRHFSEVDNEFYEDDEYDDEIENSE